MENEEVFVVYQSKFKQIGLVLLGILMVLASFIPLFAGNSLFIIIGIIGIGFFGSCEFYLIKQLIHGKKIVCLTTKGFYDYSSAMATKDLCILWDEVSEIEIKSMVNQSFVSVYLKDPDKVLANITGLQRKAIQANVKMGFGEINITLQSAKKCTNDELLVKMNQFLQ
ncbi:STM3941 family protein [Enterococcus sp. LJL99]